ncbi:alpha/beta fold hydrolase [Williamsia sp. CHRR-6]|nr:alpha/beta fold hydrolase [Williamsia sp. CHRR-6]
MASAAPAPGPRSSGLDARDYAGPIPARPGTLIAHTALDPALSLPGAGPAFRILYSTVAQRDRPAVSTGAVFLPQGTAPSGGWPVLAWAHGTVGIGDDCAPSVQPRTTVDSHYLASFLRRGYAIVATDYAGQGTPGVTGYLDAGLQGRSVVDSVKALRQLAVPTAPRYAIVGQSQGAQAAMAAARLATGYSRGWGLDYRGVVATGTPANLETVFASVGPAFPPAFVPASIAGGLTVFVSYLLVGLRVERPDLGIDRVLTPLGRSVLAQAGTACSDQFAADLARRKVTLNAMFTRGLSSLPGITAALVRYAGVPTRGYDRPIFLGHGLSDLTVPVVTTLTLAGQLTANRQPVQVHYYPGADHLGAQLVSRRDSMPFLARILNAPGKR